MRGACVLLLAALPALAAAAEPLRRQIPAECGSASAPAAEEAEGSWNEHYRVGHESIEKGDLDQAQASICGALAAAAGFGPRDWRFAEALDELGLIHYMRGDDERSIATQAGAVAEMLLARGPYESSGASRPCEPSVELYAARLGYPLTRSGRADEATSVAAAPYRVFTTSLVAVGREFAQRLPWLVSEYLGREDLAAARALQGVIDRAMEEMSR